MAKMTQKTLKLPDEWSVELTKLVGKKMVETGEEYSFVSLVKETLDNAFNLSTKTGINADGKKVE